MHFRRRKKTIKQALFSFSEYRLVIPNTHKHSTLGSRSPDIDHHAFRAFTTSHSAQVSVLRNECGVSEAYDLGDQGNPNPQISKFQAIWDTGATNCVITQEVINTCNLFPSGVVKVYGVHEPKMSESYFVNIYLPDDVALPGVRVTKGQFIGADILIGMDVIGCGDFAVTNNNGRTYFSFRIPSRSHIDFAKEIREENLSMQEIRPVKKKRRKRDPKKYGKNKRKG